MFAGLWFEVLFVVIVTFIGGMYEKSVRGAGWVTRRGVGNTAHGASHTPATCSGAFHACMYHHQPRQQQQLQALSYV